MSIFVEHWGDNLQFYPDFPLFSTLGGMNLDHNFVQVRKFSEDQKKRSSSKIEHFFPQIQVKTKKKRSSTSIEHFFPNFTLRCTPIQTTGGDTAKLMGGIKTSPHPRLVSAPLTAGAPAKLWSLYREPSPCPFGQTTIEIL